MIKRNQGIEVAKIIACLGVVFLHVFIGGFEISEPMNLNAYLYFLGTLSIPLFFMANGFFIMNKGVIGYNYSFRKIWAIVKLMFIWTVLYWAISGFDSNPLLAFFSPIIQRGYFMQFWFFYSLIVIYLSLPLLTKWLTNIARYRFVLGLLLAIIIMVEAANLFLLGPPIQEVLPQTFRLWTWYFYFMLGGFIRKSEGISIFKVLKRKYLKVMVILLILLMPFYCFYLGQTLLATTYAEYFYDSIYIVVTVAGLFYLLSTTTRLYSGLIEFFNGKTIGIFIIHYHIIVKLNGIIGGENSLINLAAIVPVFILSYVLTLAVIKLNLSKYLLKL